MEEAEKEQIYREVEEKAERLKAVRDPTTGKIPAFFISDADGDLCIMAEEMRIAEELLDRLSPRESMHVAEVEIAGVIIGKAIEEIRRVRVRLREHFELDSLEDEQETRQPRDLEEELLLLLTRIPADRKEEALEGLERLLNREDASQAATGEEGASG